MSDEELLRVLTQALTDGEISGGERRVLAAWVERATPSQATRARQLAFEAYRRLPSGPIKALEQVIELLSTKPASERHSAAFFSPGYSCVQELLRQLEAAQKSADICVFTITDDRITEAILRAHRRGIEVRVVTDDDKAHDLGSDIHRLSMEGVPCKMDIGNTAHMHHKFAIFDGTMLVNGSFNWTRSASEQNQENLITTDDDVLVSAFQERFEELWERLKSA